jgi:hypothetical protein
MRTLNEEGKLTELQQKFFAENKETEELFDIINDPFEMNNLIENPEYAEVAIEMRGHYNDWNSKNKDHGLDPINWGNASPPNAPEIVEWLKIERPKIIEKMKQGIEPGFGKLMQEYRFQNPKK